MRRQRLVPTLLVLVLIAPTVFAATSGRDPFAVEVYPAGASEKVVDPGETAEYTITVENTGDQTTTVSLTTSNDQGPNVCSSTIEPLPGPLESGASDDVTLSVNISATAEKDATCVTTVTATVTGAQPAQTEVTTTVGDGDATPPSALGVEVTAQIDEKQYQGTSPVKYTFEIKNTGQVNENISLSFEDIASENPDRCDSSGLGATLSETLVAVERDKTETVTLDVDIPEGSDAGRHCFEVTGSVTGDVTNNATDSDDVTLIIPPIHDCEVSINPSSIEIKPGESKSASVQIQNRGNEDWTVSLTGTPTSHFSLAAGEDGSKKISRDGSVSFNIELTVPEDTNADAGAKETVRIQGKDGKQLICDVTAQITVGRLRSATISASSSVLRGATPGEIAELELTVRNTGNGGDTFNLAVQHSNSRPAGWGDPNISTDKVTLSAKMTGTVSISIDVPSNALGLESVLLRATISSIDGTLFSEVTVSIEVKEVLDLSIKPSYEGAEKQIGRTDTEARFPIIIQNDGNVEDTFSLAVSDRGGEDRWATRFSDENGGSIEGDKVTLSPFSESTIYALVTIEGKSRGEEQTIEVRIQSERSINSVALMEITAKVDNSNYGMGIVLVGHSGDATRESLTLSPGGNSTQFLLLTNIGDRDDTARIDVVGEDSMVRVKIMDENGTELSISNASMKITMGESESLSIRIDVDVDAPSGTMRLIKIRTWSTKNSGDIAEVHFPVEVRIIQDLVFSSNASLERVVSPNGKAEFVFSIENRGNMDEQIRLSVTDPVRGWSLLVYDQEFNLIDEEALIDIKAGGARTFTARASPPVSASVEETLDFTVSLHKADSSKIGSQHLEFSATFRPLDEGLPGFSLFLAINSIIFSAILIDRKRH